MTTPEGDLLGDAPLTLSRGPESATTLTRLPDASERPLTKVLISAEGFESKAVELDFPAHAGSDKIVSVTLSPLPTLEVTADRRGTRVRLKGTQDILGQTPFEWRPSQEQVGQVRRGELTLEYLTPAGPVAFPLKPNHLDGQAPVRGAVRAKFKASKRTRSKKPSKPKSGWGW